MIFNTINKNKIKLKTDKINTWNYNEFNVFKEKKKKSVLVQRKREVMYKSNIQAMAKAEYC